jgi:hypothetical protein
MVSKNGNISGKN